MSVKNFFTKVTIVTLAFLLIFMGVGSFLLDNSEKKEIARVGKEVITLDEYKLLYKNYGNKTPGSDISIEQTKD